MDTIDVAKVREQLSDVLNQVAFGKERKVIKRRGKSIAVLMPLEDLARLEALEMQADIETARKARKEKGSVSWGKIKEEAGLK